MTLRNQVVFVDPDDESCLYWWPALIVPHEHLHLFQPTNGETIGSSDLVVCYFEDGSFSVVPQNAVKPFSTSSDPFKMYIRHPEIKHTFLSDRAVIRATKFIRDGIVPLSFSWLHSRVGLDGKLIEDSETPSVQNVQHDDKKVETSTEPQKHEPQGNSAVSLSSVETAHGMLSKHTISKGKKRKAVEIDVVNVKEAEAEEPAVLSSFVEYKIIKSLLPVPKSERIKQILLSIK